MHRYAPGWECNKNTVITIPVFLSNTLDTLLICCKFTQKIVHAKALDMRRDLLDLIKTGCLATIILHALVYTRIGMLFVQ